MIDQLFYILFNLIVAGVQVKIVLYFIEKWITNTDKRISDLENKQTDHGERISVLESRAPERKWKAS